MAGPWTLNKGRGGVLWEKRTLLFLIFNEFNVFIELIVTGSCDDKKTAREIKLRFVEDCGL
jgi:hypothetical protein